MSSRSSSTSSPVVPVVSRSFTMANARRPRRAWRSSTATRSGRALAVNIARPREERPPGGGGGFEAAVIG